MNVRKIELSVVDIRIILLLCLRYHPIEFLPHWLH